MFNFIAKTISFNFLVIVFSGVSNKFLITCWVIVDHHCFGQPGCVISWIAALIKPEISIPGLDRKFLSSVAIKALIKLEEILS